MSWPVTLADQPALMEKLAVHQRDEFGGGVFDATCSTTMVFAPCCGRKTAADTVVSLKGFKTEIRAGNHRPKKDLDWACDGCLHLLIADQSNGWTWSKLFRALGAPADVIRFHRAQELAREEEVRRSGEWLDLGELHERAHASLPANVREIPGTEQPPDILPPIEEAKELEELATETSTVTNAENS